MLSAVYIKGFKTFARPVRMPFEGGVTAVVGPNGSGKSNITDAVLFALGEQSPGLLRAGTMGDLIFSGSESLPQANVAEVTLVLDNSEGEVSLPYREVSLTRRVARDGGTEYRINGSRARLSDVRAVAGEAGMGRHSILRQGAVDAIVSGGAPACRQALEEAAGLGVYRRRRLSASRRLEKASAQLEQSRRIEAELAGQLKRIEREAVAAREYRETEARYRRLSLAHLYRAATRDTDGLRAGIQTSERESERLRLQVAGARESERALERDLRSKEEELRSLEATVEALEAALGNLRTGSLGADRLAVRLEARRGETRERRRLAENLRAEAGRTREGLKVLRLRHERAEADHAGRVGALEAAEASKTDLRRWTTAAERETYRLVGALEGARSRLRSLREEDAAAPTLSLEEIEASEKLSEIFEAEAPAAGRLRVPASSGRMAEVSDALNRRRGALSALRGRLEARFRALKESSPEGGRGLLRLYEVVRARAGFEFAVEAALGEAGSGLLAEDLCEGMRLVSEAERVAVRLDAAGMEESGDFEGTPLLECVEVLDERYAGAVERLLGGIYVVEDASSNHLANGHVAVTREGVRLTRTSVSLAKPARFAHEARLKANLDLLEDLRSGPEATLEGARRAFSEAASRLDAARESERLVLALAERARRSCALVVRESARRRTAARRAREHRAARQETVERLKAEAAGTEAALSRRSEELDDLREAFEAAGRAAEAARAGVERSQRARRELRAAISEGARRMDEISRRLESAASGDDRERLSTLALRAASAASRAEEASGERARRTRLLRAEKNEAYRRSSARQADLARTSADLAASLAAAEGRSQTFRRRLEEAERLSSKARQELAEEWSATLEDARREAEVNPASGPEERNELLRKLKRFGDVNLLALSQEAELRGRYETIRAQRADAEKAANELKRIIHSVDEEVRARFGRTFGRVREVFARMVPRMLVGGSGTLTLVEEGVEIGVRLGRKGGRSLKVLSGGERSLLALSFLFSILLAREESEGTFCILDEAEAALDDVNLARFLSVVDSQRDKGQFLLVTHQKRTMASADVLYGVVQDASGATSVVSKRIQGD